MKIIKCEYCGNRINEDDNKCPHCGASVVDVLKKHNEELDKERQENFKKASEMLYQSTKPVKKVFFTVFGVGLFIIIGVTVLIFTNINKTKTEVKDELHNEKQEQIEEQLNEDENKIVTVGMNETAHTEELDVTLVGYEKYNYTSDFPGYTKSVKKSGYQQIAFHLQIKNNTNKDYWITSSDISLLADSFTMESSETKTTYGFTSGKDFKQLEHTIPSLGINEGWVGFFVATDKKQLQLKVEDNIIIELENPAYKK